MPLDASRSRRRIAGPRAALVVAAIAALATACGGPAGTPRPTDPRLILTNAINATAALPSLRLHVEVAATSGPLGPNQPNAVMKATLDADVALATRELAARVSTTMPAGLGGANAGPQSQIGEIIVTQAASFSRTNAAGRWSKGSSGLGGGPTNAQIATMISNLLSNPAMTFELRDAAPCSLGTCDHVVAHIDGQVLGQAVGAVLGGSADVGNGAGVPNFDVDVLVDQSSSVVSELRTSISVGGAAEQILVVLSNPGQPVQITAPLPALVDDNTGGLGGDGLVQATPVAVDPEASAILDQVGHELESAVPVGPASALP